MVYLQKSMKKLTKRRIIVLANQPRKLVDLDQYSLRTLGIKRPISCAPHKCSFTCMVNG